MRYPTDLAIKIACFEMRYPTDLAIKIACFDRFINLPFPVVDILFGKSTYRELSMYLHPAVSHLKCHSFAALEDRPELRERSRFFALGSE